MARAAGIGLDLLEIERMERALLNYVKGQLALSLIIGASAGIGLWVFGMTGLLPHGGKYALLFGVWAGITELIPYVGPWLGAAPPVMYALVQHPLSALDVEVLGGGATVGLALHGAAQARAGALGVDVGVSLTHTRGMAAAVAILR